MPLRYLRLGFTETDLLYVYFIETTHSSLLNIDMINLKKNMIKWLYTTSGYYDKSIASNYMDAVHPDNNDPVTYIQYFDTLLMFLKESDIFNYRSHVDDKTNQFNLFLGVIKSKSNSKIDKDKFFEFTKNKSVLVISPFSELFQQQWRSNKCKKLTRSWKQYNH